MFAKQVSSEGRWKKYIRPGRGVVRMTRKNAVVDCAIFATTGRVSLLWKASW